MSTALSTPGLTAAVTTKPSGVPWLGDIPAHWEVVPLKYCCTQHAQYGANISSEEYTSDGLRFLRTTDINDHGFLNEGGVFVDQNTAQEYTLKNNDILISRSGTIGRAFIYNTTQHPPCAYAGYLVKFTTTEKLAPRYFFYFTKSIPFVEWIETQIVSSTIDNLNGQKYSQCPIPLPPPAEQRAIADFLDARTGRIDRLVERKRTLIERLREKRAALIARCVTRGLPAAGIHPQMPPISADASPSPHLRSSASSADNTSATAPLRPSGIPWLGDIPAHWEVKQGRYIGTLLGSESPDEANFTDDESASDSVAYAKVDDLNRLSEELELTATKARVIGCNAINGPFILFPKRGAAIFTNKVAIAKMDLLFDPNLMGWRIYPEFHPKFVAYCLISRRLDDLADTSTIPQINNKHIYPASFPAPPLAEQTAIAAHLDHETGRLDRLITRVETAVSRLLEYRSALITAAVTGKITIKGFQP